MKEALATAPLRRICRVLAVNRSGLYSVGEAKPASHKDPAAAQPVLTERVKHWAKHYPTH